MKRLMVFIFYLLPLLLQAQTYDPDSFKHYVIPIPGAIDNTNTMLYDSLKNYNLIMIGEKHGTKEYVQFMDGLIKDFTIHHKKVIAGFEIWRGIMHDSLKNLSYEQLANSEFFNKDIDGRENSTSANIISKLSYDSNITLVFFDVSSKYPKKTQLHLKDTSKASYINYLGLWRDSMMYESLDSAIKKDTNAVAISISGDYHTMIERQNSMAYFFKHDSASALKDRRMLTIRDISDTGTMLNNAGKGLQLNTVYKEGKIIPMKIDNNTSFYLDDVVKYNNYLLLTPYPLFDGYRGILFIRNVTAAMPCKN